MASRRAWVSGRSALLATTTWVPSGSAGGSAGVGEPDDAHVGEELELEVKPPLGARPPEVGAPGRPVGRGREARVAPAAAGPADGEDPLAWRRQVPEALAGLAVGDNGAEGDP